MFLKRLEVVGFKSFADRIGIDFVPGVTAVVGPNGSGKSNVTDAIRWVLGEQSAKSLRGSKMEDVIFAGSQSRKPLNFAEVSLILDNEDARIPISFSEISVTRRVYRSGDSEYLLNNQQCRLKDITDLFLDSGLGKEAFSIISQGRVDEILNSRPDDRRTIFEEAAGVLKYKIRKKKAEDKLSETDDNLNRVLDILHELESRLEPLKEQASIAKDYLQMSEELKQLDIGLIVHDIKENRENLTALQQEFHQLKDKEIYHANKISSVEQELSGTRAQLNDIDHNLDNAQEQLVEASTELERFEGRKVLLQEKKHNIQKQLEQLEQAIKEAIEDEASLNEKKVENSSLFDNKQQEIQSLKQAIKQLEQTLNRSASEIEQEIEQQKNLYIDLLNEEATIKNDLKHIEQQMVQHEETAKRMDHQTEDLEKKLQEATNVRAELESKHAEIVGNLQGKLQQLEAFQQQLSKVNQSFEEKQQMLYKAYQHKQQLKARKDTLEELEADFSGFFHGVKEVLQARERKELTGIVGAVAELIQVEGKYSQAIETALGAASQHIVTNTEQDAQKAIGFLKAKRAGRATFLPKSVMKSRKLHPSQYEAASKHPAFLNLAFNLISFDETNRTIIENLLGNVIVASNLQGASEIARICGFKYRVVTLEGDIVNAGGSLTGGSQKQQTNLFTRKAELDTLTTQLGQMENSIVEAEKIVARLKEQSAEFGSKVNVLSADVASIRQEEMSLKAKLVEAEMQEKSLKTTVMAASSEKSSASSKTSELLTQKEEKSKRLTEISEQLKKVNDEVDNLTKVKEQMDSEKDTIREQYSEKKSELAVLQEQLSQIQLQAADIAIKQDETSKKLTVLKDELEWLQNEDEKHPSEEEIVQAIKDWQEKKESCTKEIQELRNTRNNLQQQIVKLEEELKEQQRIHKGYMENLRSIELKQNRLEFEVNRLTNQLEEDYDMYFEDAQKEVMEMDNVEQIRKKVKLLKISIEELGVVNLTAIEEYEHVEERHTFLTEQRNDLIEAQDTLKETIKELDEEMSIRFTESFSMIQHQFKLVFRELFGGGEADLVLLDPTNILETGIEIVAQPPGKKLQSLSLLSGGERALTAIALLFAILNTRPVPFVILDEVEAALDEANVARYSDYLKKLSRDTQFIVITHRKGTMEGADVLYGITMQESGVSKLVSVKLEEDVELVGQRSGNS